MLGVEADGNAGCLRDIGPSDAEIDAVVNRCAGSGRWSGGPWRIGRPVSPPSLGRSCGCGCRHLDRAPSGSSCRRSASAWGARPSFCMVRLGRATWLATKIVPPRLPIENYGRTPQGLQPKTNQGWTRFCMVNLGRTTSTGIQGITTSLLYGQLEGRANSLLDFVITTVA